MTEYNIMISEEQRKIIARALEAMATTLSDENIQILAEIFEEDLIAFDATASAEDQVLNGVCY